MESLSVEPYLWWKGQTIFRCSKCRDSKTESVPVSSLFTATLAKWHFAIPTLKWWKCNEFQKMTARILIQFLKIVWKRNEVWGFNNAWMANIMARAADHWSLPGLHNAHLPALVLCLPYHKINQSKNQGEISHQETTKLYKLLLRNCHVDIHSARLILKHWHIVWVA